MKPPWFHIIEIIEPRGRSMADIARSVAMEKRVSLNEMRSNTMRQAVQRARYEAFMRIKMERPDLSSERIGDYFRVEGSTVRNAWRRMQASQARPAFEGFM